jgi:hypothetical protein
MCYQAKEIQKAWNPKYGDTVADMFNKWFLDEEGLESHKFHQPYVWLPTIEDLIGMHHLRDVILNDYDLIWALKKFAHKDDSDKKLEFRMNEWFLKFIMYELFSKRWDGIDWKVEG